MKDFVFVVLLKQGEATEGYESGSSLYIILKKVAVFYALDHRVHLGVDEK